MACSVKLCRVVGGLLFQDCRQDRVIHNILIVEEDAAVRNELSKFLGSTLGYQVDCVGDGQEAIEKAMAGKYDLCLLDTRNGPVRGPGAYTRLKQIHSEIEAIPMSMSLKIRWIIFVFHFRLKGSSKNRLTTCRD
jgi:DNA-binding NarL/FixJ family response regulator